MRREEHGRNLDGARGAWRSNGKVGGTREKDIVFDWKEILSFEGETGPYVQYTYVRTNSIMKKAGVEPDENVDLSNCEKVILDSLTNKEEVNIIIIIKFPLSLLLLDI